jgi:hypothetical protein
VSEIRSVLDELFKVPEEEVRTFSEVMRTPVANLKEPAPSDNFDKIKSGKPDVVAASARLVVQTNGYVAIESGYDSDDHVWHIEPYRPREWKVSIDRVIYACIQVLNSVIPSTIGVNVFLPFADWENQIITFKAANLRLSWNVTDDDLKAATLKLLEVLRALV